MGRIENQKEGTIRKRERGRYEEKKGEGEKW